LKTSENINREQYREAGGNPYRDLIADVLHQALDDLLVGDEYSVLSKQDVSTMGLTNGQLVERKQRCHYHRTALSFLRNRWGQELLELLGYDVGAVRNAIKEKYGWSIVKKGM